MLRPETALLLEKLPYGKTSLEQLWELLGKIATVPPGGQRALLRTLLDSLSAEKHVNLPQTQNCWDHSAHPSLPIWVLRRKPVVERNYASGIIWSPELSFRSARKELANSPWLKIDAWLKRTRNTRQSMVPVQERSLEIFGEEKTLGDLGGTQPFKSGMISFQTLSCYYVPEPVAWERGPQGSEEKPGLCVENSATYHVMCKFNREEGLWGFVVYGRGNGFASLVVEGVLPIMEEFGHTKILYFGDGDHMGMEIAASGAKAFAAAGKELQLDTRLYKLMSDVGKLAGSNNGGVLSPLAAKLVSQAGLDEMCEFFLQKRRIAQEWVGYWTLKKWSMSGKGVICDSLVEGEFVSGRLIPSMGKGADE